MTRNLKTLGLALAAVLALSAALASTASAQEQGKFTSDGPFYLTGTETGEPINNNFFQNAFGKLTCPGTTYFGSKFFDTPHQSITSGANTITVVPVYPTHCTVHVPLLGTRLATVTLNACDFEISVTNTTPAGNKDGTYGSVAQINCKSGWAIEVHVYKANPLSHSKAEQICRITVGPEDAKGNIVNVGLTGPHFKNTPGEADDIDLSGTFNGVHEEHWGTLCGGTEAAEQTAKDAEITLDLTLRGDNGAGENTPATVTD